MRQAALLLLFLFPTLLSAQGTITGGGGVGMPGRVGPTDTRQAASPQPAKPEDLCTVEGQVVNAVTGEPIRRASIMLMRADPVPGETGPPTTYSTLHRRAVRHEGHRARQVPPDREPQWVCDLTMVQEADAAGDDTVPDPPAAHDGSRLKLTPHAVITGRILMRSGAEANARVMLQGHR
jgi:hypothetical protein